MQYNNKYEVLYIDGHIFVPNENSSSVYDLVHQICVQTKTACWQSPEKYEFRQKTGFIAYEPVKDFKIDMTLVLDILAEHGYNITTLNETDYPEVQMIFVQGS